uniref:variable large family protein n=2 Tax=Borreliella garinii TaxID=29519 RepID=UPI001AEF12E0
VSKVSGEQILSAIIKDAGDDITGAAANNARNPIAAAIGGAQHNGAAFGNNMNTDDKIAAAIVLRGMATNGKFAAANGDNGVKEAIKSAVEKFSGWLTEMLKAVKETAEKTGSGAEEIGKVDTAGAGGTADKDSVNGIAKGMKGI